MKKKTESFEIDELIEELKNRIENTEYINVQDLNEYEVKVTSDKKHVHSTSGRGQVTILIIRGEK